MAELMSNIFEDRKQIMFSVHKSKLFFIKSKSKHKISAHSLQLRANRADKNNKKGQALDVNFRSNLVPRACDPREGTRGSGIIRFREESDWLLKWSA
jgi:hypothetical protein